MNNQMRPGTIALLAGGAVLAISTFLPWYDYGKTYSGISGDTPTQWLGIFCLLSGLAIAILVGLMNFGSVALPDQVLGFSWNQIFTVFGFTSLVITLGLLLGGDTGFGLILSLLASGAILGGGIVESQQDSGAAAPPTTF